MAEVPKNQLALVAENFQGDFTVKEIPVPEIEEDEILVNLEYSGICHTDVHCHEGIYGPLVKLPYIGGHEGSGKIVKMGGNVKNWKIGDKVGVQMMNNACSSCEFCKKEKHFLCPSIVEFGVSRPGTFQQYIAVKPYDAVKLPDHADLSIIAPILCAGVTIYSALRQCHLLPGECVALSGAGGGLGSLGIQYAKSMGYRVLAIDHSSKEQHCRSLGADYFVDAFSENLVPYIVQQTDGGPHAMINMANSMKAVNDAILYLRKGSIIVQLSVPKESNARLIYSEYFNDHH
ncbi:hypothetical protein WR25_16320 isoform A [Diploscapter pachys]|uniref:alcohol dehydrogenase n=1 Tax=Diploscapter pachys TaxID=2018661 RepID=A0A2A2JD25_9BILA|nr:hypothetical protein WR25_16320 isoform A [Diploscapter pachys]